MIIEILVKFDTETGKTAVIAPMKQKPLCYHILKEARKAIRDYRKPLAQATPAPRENELRMVQKGGAQITRIPLTIVGGDR